jgi:leucyl-tRNA synthetase
VSRSITIGRSGSSSSFYKSDLAYRGEALVNWSPTLQTVLANEQVIDGKDERTGQPVVQKMMTAVVLPHDALCRRAARSHDNLDYPEPIKTDADQLDRAERRRTGRLHTPSSGSHPIEVFTTRPDTLLGATFMVLARPNIPW